MKNVFALLVFALLASPGLAQDQAAVARAVAGCGPDKTQFEVTTDKKQHPEAKAEACKAVVYVFEDERRDPNQRLGVVTIRIGLDGKWVGANHGKSYFFFSLDPGEPRSLRELAIEFQDVFEAGVGGQPYGGGG